ncbi:monovalent cation/H+ antiporter complex subunit F [Modestobacter sp. SYSU DS0511]
MSVIVGLIYGMLALGAVLAMVRLALGPSLLDRVVATDTILVIVAAGLAVHAALDRDPTVVPVLVVVAMLVFVGAVSVARYIGGMLLRTGADDEDLGISPAAAQLETPEDGGRR